MVFLRLSLPAPSFLSGNIPRQHNYNLELLCYYDMVRDNQDRVYRNSRCFKNIGNLISFVLRLTFIVLRKLFQQQHLPSLYKCLCLYTVEINSTCQPFGIKGSFVDTGGQHFVYQCYYNPA